MWESTSIAWDLPLQRSTFLLFLTWPASITLEVRVRKSCSAVGCQDQHKRPHQPPASEGILMEMPAQQLEKLLRVVTIVLWRANTKLRAVLLMAARINRKVIIDSYLRMSWPSWLTLFLMDVTEISLCFMLELLDLIDRFEIVAQDSSENVQQPCLFILIVVILIFLTC